MLQSERKNKDLPRVLPVVINIKSFSGFCRQNQERGSILITPYKVRGQQKQKEHYKNTETLVDHDSTRNTLPISGFPGYIS